MRVCLGEIGKNEQFFLPLDRGKIGFFLDFFGVRYREFFLRFGKEQTICKGFRVDQPTDPFAFGNVKKEFCKRFEGGF